MLYELESGSTFNVSGLLRFNMHSLAVTQRVRRRAASESGGCDSFDVSHGVSNKMMVRFALLRCLALVK
jgi:hypothetical protein